MNDLHFIVGHGNIGRRKNIFQILYQLRMKLTLFYFSINIRFAEAFDLEQVDLVYNKNSLLTFHHEMESTQEF